jgi:3-oxoacyl-[acyl-carrier-protein] synthase-1
MVGLVPTALTPVEGEHPDIPSRALRLAAAALAEVRERTRAVVFRYGAARVGIVIGCSNGCVDATERAVSHRFRHGTLPPGYHLPEQHASTRLIALTRAQTGITGPGMAISTTCASSAKALASARRWLDVHTVDAVLVLGVEGLSQSALMGFHALGILDSAPCRPFAASRRGLSLGEGSAALIVERHGEAAVQLCAVGESSDAYQTTAPHPEGDGIARAMRAALEEAGVQASEIDHVNAHGTATQLNDIAESRAIAAVLDGDVPVVSTKGYTGHLLGAAGALEAVLAAIAIEDGKIPASVGALPVDPALPVCVAAETRRAQLRYVLSNSCGFGGHNASVLLGATP